MATKEKMSDETTFKKGDAVTWDSSGGEIEGKVVKTITAETKIKGHTAKATEDDPQILVKSDKTGAEAAHKPESLHKK